MSGHARTPRTSRRWRSALRAGALVAALAVVGGVPLAAQAHEWEHHGWRGHEWREHQEWREHYRPYYEGGYYGYAAPRYYYGYGYAAPGYGYGYAYPGVTLNFRD